jgi:hypothetical protein
MAKARKMWVYQPPKPAKPPVPAALKTAVEDAARDVIDSFLKPTYLKPPPEDQQFNYVADIYGRWYRGYFYFCSLYNSPGPNALSPSFEAKFARLEYVGNDRFNLAYMRHTGQWVEVYEGLTLAECLDTIRNESFFQP